MKLFTLLATALLCVGVNASDELLPPTLAWKGDSEKLLTDVPPEWATPAEQNGFTATPSYDETVAYLRRLQQHSPLIQIQEFGRTPQGRPMLLVIASHAPEPLLNKRVRLPQTRVLIQAGIHAGEIDGKDAGLMLLRDIALGKKPDLLADSDFYFIPVFNVDGHERVGGNNRVNQRGPDNMGWRTTANNLNLNRDYMKAETVEMQALLKLFQRIDPEVYIDVHVTDGIDYQYDITYGYVERFGASPRIAAWLGKYFRPYVDRALKKNGHIPGPLVFAIDNQDLSKGIADWHASPRYSQGYGDLRQIASVLIENHSLKPYQQRVLGTYVLMEEILRIAGKQRAELRAAIKGDKEQRLDVLSFRHVPDEENVRNMEFLGVSHELYDSPVSGQNEIRWTGQAQKMEIPVLTSKPSVFTTRPKAYWLHAGWTDAVNVLRKHGIRMEEVKQATEKTLEFYRLPDAKIDMPNFEGRLMINSGAPVVESLTQVFAPGSVRINTDQPLGDLVVALMEPQSEDSLMSWGYFASILNATEYIEGYVVEPLAQKMLLANPELQAAFDEALKDETFANSAEARLRWFYEKSAFKDKTHLLYPVGIER